MPHNVFQGRTSTNCEKAVMAMILLLRHLLLLSCWFISFFSRFPLPLSGRRISFLINVAALHHHLRCLSGLIAVFIRFVTLDALRSALRDFRCLGGFAGSGGGLVKLILLIFP